MILFRKLILCCFFAGSLATAAAQNKVTSLPTLVKAPVSSPTTAPLILYITGDGGMKKFSANMISAFNQRNYPVVALNALKYFWNKKTPQQAAKDVSDLINYYQSQWNTKNGVILVGYSLGADVLSFVYTNLPPATAAEVKQLVFLSPSAYTDLEVHVSDMLGRSNNKGFSVLSEINKIQDKPLLLVFGDEEKDFNVGSLHVQYQKLVLPGGHNYDEDANGVADKILAALHK
ncbi:virulence protein (VirJ) [Chitinophaga terrae (ex Kim and Jung 2007)]|uniref:Virulence protein (VirJ) n=1 Tax=Chitinophaga terrae (ex Kim and Jung 2007) TaxID=408074 RepID=A0A1H4FIY1_9BACT|nr:AcvB/VirJ family lysyl-phosphatidylglycerol hydrolase [Chitinophaga terrae (ex Kim and Jung 2007)]MDQ0105845.1 type IV secretory pathway VirJ component [Chitinophaga terrae (ex Kim and Jung 2007)]SEA97111.1 virulence protein (VirJ) [Chitinophaga terrae (ex Kim and Jung 2007)]